MSHQSSSVTIDQVRRTEIDDIVVRREQLCGTRSPGSGSATTQPATPTNLDPKHVANDLVGVALSGGGLRSAFFNVGFTRALHRVGLFRLVDYLSTVSGGGYVGTLLSAASLRRKSPFGKGDFPVDSLAAATGVSAETAQSQDLLCSGGYLRRPWVLINKYLIGFFFINVAVFSGLFALCAIVAYAWRLLDLPWVRDRLHLVGCDSDLLAPFLPMIGFVVAWVIAWAISYWRRGAEAPGWLAQRLLYLIVASFLIALALLIGNGDTSLGALQSWFDLPSITFQRNIRAPLLVLVIGMVLPLFNARRIIESGVRPKQKWHRWIFGTVTLGLLVGVPLAIIGFLARENVSGFATEREPDLLKEDIKDTVQGWRRLCNLMLDETLTEPKDGTSTSRPVPGWAQMDETSLTRPSNEILRIKSALNKFAGAKAALEGDDHCEFAAYFKSRLSDLSGKLNEQVDLEEQINGPPGQWLRWNNYGPGVHTTYLLLASLVDTNAVTQYWRAKQEAEAIEDEVCAILSAVVLTNPGLYKDQAFQHISREKITEKKDAEAETITLKTVDKTPDKAALPGDLGIVSDDSVRAFLERKKADLKDGAAFVELWREARETETDKWPWQSRKQFNRMLLEAHYPEIFEQRSEIRRRIVIYEDQSARVGCFVWALMIFLVAGAWVDVNSTSMHRFYRDQLAGVFIRPQQQSARQLLLSDLATTDRGAPYHLISASINWPQQSVLSGKKNRPAYLETRPQSIPFLFSRRFCGSNGTGYTPSLDYEGRLLDPIDLADAMALSGAAVTPGQINNWLIAFLMFIFNLRLGQWLPNPSCGAPRFRVRILLWFANAWYPARKRPYVFVADGGYSENLGVLPLLQRRCRLIIASDASCDPNYEFADLARLVEHARLREQIEISELHQPDETGQPSDLRTKLLEPTEPSGGEKGSDSKKRGLSNQHFMLARIRYPATATESASEGLLVYVKPSFDGDEGLPVTQYRSVSPQFPHEPSSDQDYDVSQADAYSRLGEHIGMRIAQALPGKANAPRIPDLWERSDVTAEKLCEWFMQLAEPKTDEAGDSHRDSVDDVTKAPKPEKPHDLKSLIEMLADTDPSAREFAAAELGSNGSLAEPAVVALHNALNDRYLAVRRAARNALFDLGALAVTVVVEGLLNKSNSVRMRRQCAWILREWANEQQGPIVAAQELRMRLEAAALGADERVQRAVVEVLAALDRLTGHRRTRPSGARQRTT